MFSMHHLFLAYSVVLWLGDLNYRLSDLDVDNVKDLIAKKDFETLHSYDQVGNLKPLNFKAFKCLLLGCVQ